MPAMTAMENVFLGVEPRRSGVVSRRQMRKEYDEPSVAGASGSIATRSSAPSARLTSRRWRSSEPSERGQDHHPRRADLVADPRGDGGAAPDDAGPARRGQDHRVRQPLPRRGPRAVRHDHRVAQRPPGAHRPAGAETEATLVAGMFGAAAEAEQFDKPPGSTAPPMLEVEGLQQEGMLHDISLTVRAGEIVGIAGLVEAVAASSPERSRARTASTRGPSGSTARSARSVPDRRDLGRHRVPDRGAQEGRPVHGALVGRQHDVRRHPCRLRAGILRRGSGTDPGSWAPRVALRRPPVARSAGQEPLRRQSAEGAVRAVALLRPEGPDPR